MTTADHAFESACCQHLDRFFSAYPNPMLQQQTMKALRLLRACDKPLGGKPEGWAAGIVYALANRDWRACGVPGMLNAEFEECFGVTVSTICRRAAQVARALEI